jgi:hypothetical protein
MNNIFKNVLQLLPVAEFLDQHIDWVAINCRVLINRDIILNFMALSASLKGVNVFPFVTQCFTDLKNQVV